MNNRIENKTGEFFNLDNWKHIECETFSYYVESEEQSNPRLLIKHSRFLIV